MRDFYLKTNDKAAVLAELGIELQGSYYQDENFIVDWIGQIPIIVNDEVVGSKEGDHFNVRVLNPSFEQTIINLTSAVTVDPEPPYRIFA